MDFRGLPALALHKILEELDTDGQLASARVCKSWNEAARTRRSQLRLQVRSRFYRGPLASSIAADELSAALQRFPHLTSLKLAKADEDTLEWLPPLAQLRSLDFERCDNTALAPSLPGFTALTALSITTSHCSQLTGGLPFLGLPLLEELSITCLAGDFIHLLSTFPEMPVLRRFSITCFAVEGELQRNERADSFPWMRSLRSVAVRWAPLRDERYRVHFRGTVWQPPNTVLPILVSCTSVEELSLAASISIYLHASSILAISKLENLRSLSLDQLEPVLYSHELAEAWRGLRERMVELGIPSKYRQRLELGCLPKLQKLDLLPVLDKREDLVELSHLPHLKELGIDSERLAQLKEVTWLQKLTQLTTTFSLNYNIDNQLEGIRVIRNLPSLTRLSLILALPSGNDQMDLPKVTSVLDTAVSSSSVALDLKIKLWQRLPPFPLSFLERVESNLVSLSLSGQGFWRTRLRKGLSPESMNSFQGSLSLLPSLGRLRRLQLMFDYNGSDTCQWLHVLRPETLRSLSQLRYLCLVPSIYQEAEEIETRRLSDALASRLPGLREVCVHGQKGSVEFYAWPRCSSCKANDIQDVKWWLG